jgi:hypothetical protein
MTENEALNILVQVALKAQSFGALKLEESVLVKEAIDTFTVKKEEVEHFDKATDQVDTEKIKNLKSVKTQDAF